MYAKRCFIKKTAENLKKDFQQSFDRGDDRARTCDILRVMQTLSQLSYTSISAILALYVKIATSF